VRVADPTNPLVTAFVEEIIECANHFGAGAVLERHGEVIVRRNVDPKAERQALLV